jgi:hypothetical protein
MEVTKTGNKKAELLTAIKGSMGDGRDVINRLNDFFRDCVNKLRVEESKEVLLQLAEAIENLQYFIEFASELKNGMACFDNFGMNDDPISSENSGVQIFRDLLSAMENQDWVMLADLVEYELSPLLTNEDEWMGKLKEKLETYDEEANVKIS